MQLDSPGRHKGMGIGAPLMCQVEVTSGGQGNSLR